MDQELKIYLDGKFGDVEKRFVDVENKFGDVEKGFVDVEKRFVDVEKRFVDVENNFGAVNNKFGGLERRFVDLDHRLDRDAADTSLKFEQVDNKFEHLEARLIERMRDMQTELLRGFQSFSTGQTIRLKKLEADQTNLDLALRGRVDVLEARLFQIEMRLGKDLL